MGSVEPSLVMREHIPGVLLTMTNADATLPVFGHFVPVESNAIATASKVLTIPKACEYAGNWKKIILTRISGAVTLIVKTADATPITIFTFVASAPQGDFVTMSYDGTTWVVHEWGNYTDTVA
jgi:hypothetical protein